MKFKSLLQFVFVLLVGQFLFACSSAEYYRFASVKPETYHKANAKADPALALKENTPTVAEATVVTPQEEAIQIAEPVLEAKAGPAEPILFEKKRINTVKPTIAPKATVPNVEETAVLKAATERLSTMTKAEKKEFKKEVRNALRETNEVDTVVKVILAILLPPLAVFLHEGIGSRFWISLLLTLLFFIPGVIYALLVVTDSI